MSIDSLSTDILGIIFKYLNTQELIFASRTCKHWRRTFEKYMGKYDFSLKFWGSNIIDQDLGYLKNAHKIDLTACKAITDQGLSNLVTSTGLRVHTLILAWCTQITDEGLKHLRYTKNQCQRDYEKGVGLQKIDVTHCDKITDRGLKYLGKGRQLHSVNLSDCTHITDAGLKYFRGVHKINLSYCRQITDEGLRNLLPSGGLSAKKREGEAREEKRERRGEKKGGVHSIILAGCQITDRGLQYLGEEGLLVKISLTGLSETITDKGLRYLSGVKEISLSWCFQITDNGLQYLSSSKANAIQRINISNCPQISNLGLQEFVASQPKLRTMWLCGLSSKPTLNTLQSINPNVEIFYLE